MYGQLIIVIAVTIAIQPIATAPADDIIPIVHQEQEGPNPDGSYKYSYETGDGIKAKEEGEVQNAGSDNEAMQARGEYSYESDDGQISVKYVANENGYVPKGSHLPTTPPIPPLIQKALDWIAANPPKDDQ